MDTNQKVCECILEDLVLDLTSAPDETEDLEEIDEDELVEDPFIPHNIIWQEISDNFDNERKQIEEYKLTQITGCVVPLSPPLQFLTEHIFSLLIPNILTTTINTAIEKECIKHQKNVFNSIDFIAEMLWNLNPLHPERRDNWTYIFDMDWVDEWLNNHPRPYYPLSYLWNREWGATKIQAAMRGHWVRCRDNVQEMRLFWRILAKEREAPEEPEVHQSRVNIVEQ